MKLLHKFNLTKSLKQIFGIFNLCKLSESNNKQKYIDRWHLSAEGFLLLPSALRPHLSISILTILFLGVAAETFWLTDGASAATLEITVPANYSINLDPGTSTTFGESSNQQISIKTSGSFGYTLNIKGSSDTNLKNGSNVIKTITKAEGYESSDDYKNSDEVNTWAYKPGKLNSLNNTKYLPFPSIDTVLDKTDASNDVENKYDLIIAAKVDNTLPSGTYSNNFVISATVNTVNYRITYNVNEGNPNIPVQSDTTTENKIKLSSTEPTKEDYEFIGWCDMTPINNNTENPSCSGRTYQAGADYTLTNGDNTVTLNAMWKQTILYMQNWTGCNGLTQHNGSNGNSIYITLTDKRDKNEYKVAKLADGKCWMVENLRIAGITVYAADSDMPSGSISIPNSASNFSGTNNNAAYNNPSYGGFYSWYTATAGSGTSSVSSGEASSSICPKGWRLPKGGTGTTDEFVILDKAYGGTGSSRTNANTYSIFTSSPVIGFTPNVGYFSGGTFDTNNNTDQYWSSTANSSSNAYTLYLQGSSSYVAFANDPKNRGLMVRCIAR